MRMFYIFLLFVLSVGNAYGINWMTSFEDAQRLAIAQNKFIVIDFWAEWCAPCREMDSDSWNTPELNEFMESFIALKVNVDIEKLFSSKYGIYSIPYVYIIDPIGEVVAKSEGYKRKDELLSFLKKYALDTSFLQKEIINFYQEENMATSLILAKKYINYSLLLEEDNTRYNMLSLVDKYLYKAEKYLYDNSKYKQKIEFLEHTVDVCMGNFNRVSRKLSKLKEEDVNTINIADFYFLNYCIARNEQDTKQEAFWIKKMKDSDVYNQYKFKIKKIFN